MARAGRVRRRVADGRDPRPHRRQVDADDPRHARGRPDAVLRPARRARRHLAEGAHAVAARALERDGLVARRAYKQVPPKVEYSLTELGGSLCAPVKELRAWAEDHIGEVRGARGRYGGAGGGRGGGGPPPL